MAILWARAPGITQILSIGCHIFTPAVGDPVIDQWSKAYRRAPALVPPAEADIELTLKILCLFRTDDDIGLVSCHIKIAVEAGGIDRGPEALDRRIRR